VPDPSLPSGDSLEQFADYDGAQAVDLVIRGNLLEFSIFPIDATSQPVGTVPTNQSIINLANDFETTICG
jgi:hypothetical protein